MKPSHLLPAVFILLLYFFSPSCKKETPWASKAFVGNFSGNETCLVGGAQSSTIGVTAVSATQVSISNLYGLGKSVNGIISNDSCIIQPQVNDTVVIQGLIILSSDTLNLSLIASSFGLENKCAAVLVKQ